MIVTRDELVKTRITLLKQMNDYIINLGDEDIWTTWITLGVPDCPSEEDFFYIADSNVEWQDVCKLFGMLVAENA